MTSAHTRVDQRREGVRAHRAVLGHLQRVQFVDLIEEIGADGGGMHGQYVNTIRSHLNSERGGKLSNEGLGGAVHDREGIRDIARDGRSENESSFQVFFKHFLEEVVGDLDARSRVAFHVGQLAVERGGVEESSYYVACVVVDDSHIDVLSALDR